MHDFLVVFLFCISRTPIEKMLLYDLHYASKCHSTASQIFTPFPSVSNGTLCKFLHLLRQVTLFSLCADGYTTLGFCLVCKHFTTHLPLASVILGFAVWLAAHAVIWNIPVAFSFVSCRILHGSAGSLHLAMYCGHLISWVLHTGFVWNLLVAVIFFFVFLASHIFCCVPYVSQYSLHTKFLWLELMGAAL